MSRKQPNPSPPDISKKPQAPPAPPPKWKIKLMVRVKINFVLSEVEGEIGNFVLWANHGSGFVEKVATFKGRPRNQLADSCALVYERGVKAGIREKTGRDEDIDVNMNW